MNESVRTISDYLKFVSKTDRLPADDLAPVLQGLFGEVGGLMSAAKKIKREPDVFIGFNEIAIEEFGDAFWYLCCLATRLDIDIEHIFLDVAREDNADPEVLIGSEGMPVSVAYNTESNQGVEKILVNMGKLTGNFLDPDYIKQESKSKVKEFLQTYFFAMKALELNFSQIIETNLQKVSSRFIRPTNEELPNFDEGFPEYERLPDEFRIEFMERVPGQQAMRWNKVFIGDPLTDSIRGNDLYRFHDVFHFAFAAILHWSPTFRSLIKHKRKSKPEIDETEDSGRAIVVEEGLSAWVFSIAKENNFFENKENLTFDMLKNIGQFVKGFEVEQCPLILWEEAILSAYSVFRDVKRHNGGVIICNRNNRTIKYQKL